MSGTEIGVLKEKALRCELLPANDIKWICEKAREVFAAEDNVVNIASPVTVAGDTHGQFHDLLELFKTGGDVPGTKYVFLGDYVDRGHHSVQVITLLFLIKIEHPEHIILLRGNHEARAQTQVFGFYDECLLKYGDSKAWSHFTSTFDFMPVAAVIDSRLFCAHGGISPSAPHLDDLRTLERVTELPFSGPLCDIAWSDPEDDHCGWRESPRGAGYTFGEDAVEIWNNTNGLEGIVRAHQMVYEGFFWHHNRKTLTLFSAPNYMYRAGNTAAVLELDTGFDRFHFNQFLAAAENEEDIEEPISYPSPYFL